MVLSLLMGWILRSVTFIVMVGPSRYGTTAVFRGAVGLEQAVSGGLRIGNRSPLILRPGTMVQRWFFKIMPCAREQWLNNVGFALKLGNELKLEIDNKVAKAASILGLGQSLRRKPSQLSNNQRQRGASGRALVRASAAFLRDGRAVLLGTSGTSK